MMKVTGRRVLIKMVPILIAVLVAMVWAFSYHTFEFKGGISIRDTGFLSYPRYHAQLVSCRYGKTASIPLGFTAYHLARLI